MRLRRQWFLRYQFPDDNLGFQKLKNNQLGFTKKKNKIEHLGGELTVLTVSYSFREGEKQVETPLNWVWPESTRHV